MTSPLQPKEYSKEEVPQLEPRPPSCDEEYASFNRHKLDLDSVKPDSRMKKEAKVEISRIKRCHSQDEYDTSCHRERMNDVSATGSRTGQATTLRKYTTEFHSNGDIKRNDPHMVNKFEQDRMCCTDTQIPNLRPMLEGIRDLEYRRGTAKRIANDELLKLFRSDMFSLQKQGRTPEQQNALRRIRELGSLFMSLSPTEVTHDFLQDLVSETQSLQKHFRGKQNNPTANFLFVIAPFLRQAIALHDNYCAEATAHEGRALALTMQQGGGGNSRQKDTGNSTKSLKQQHPNLEPIQRKHSSITLDSETDFNGIDKILEDFEGRWSGLQEQFSERKRAISVIDEPGGSQTPRPWPMRIVQTGLRSATVLNPRAMTGSLLTQSLDANMRFAISGAASPSHTSASKAPVPPGPQELAQGIAATAEEAAATLDELSIHSEAMRGLKDTAPPPSQHWGEEPSMQLVHNVQFTAPSLARLRTVDDITCRICEQIVDAGDFEEHMALCLEQYRQFYTEQRLHRVREALEQLIQQGVLTLAHVRESHVPDPERLEEALRRKLDILLDILRALGQVEGLWAAESPAVPPAKAPRTPPALQLPRNATDDVAAAVVSNGGQCESNGVNWTDYDPEAVATLYRTVPCNRPKVPRDALRQALEDVNLLSGEMHELASELEVGQTREEGGTESAFQVATYESSEVQGIIPLIQDVIDSLGQRVEHARKALVEYENSNDDRRVTQMLHRIKSFHHAVATSPSVAKSQNGSPPARVSSRLDVLRQDHEQQKLAYAKHSTVRAFAEPRVTDFELLKPISRGAYGRVFLATKKTTGDLYAIKIMDKAEMLRKKQTAHIMAERNVLSRANCPYVVKLYFSFQTRQRLFLVMEFVRGGDLLTMLQGCGPLAEGVVRQYVAEVVVALKYLHESLGVCHRDLKPDNILLDMHGHIKLTDFGLSPFGVVEDLDLSSSVIGDKSPPDTPNGNHPNEDFAELRTSVQSLLRQSSSSSIGSTKNKSPDPRFFPHLPTFDPKASSTERGKSNRRKQLRSRVGTPDYMAPEILLGTGHDVTCDWWSLGIIVYELLCGEPPFSDDSPEKIFKNILNFNLSPIPEGIDVSEDAVDLIVGLLVRNPRKRLGARGASEVQAMSFFHGIEWQKLERGEFVQEAPFVPSLECDADTSYFKDDLESDEEDVMSEILREDSSVSSDGSELSDDRAFEFSEDEADARRSDESGAGQGDALDTGRSGAQPSQRQADLLLQYSATAPGASTPLSQRSRVSDVDLLLARQHHGAASDDNASSHGSVASSSTPRRRRGNRKKSQRFDSPDSGALSGSERERHRRRGSRTKFGSGRLADDMFQGFAYSNLDHLQEINRSKIKNLSKHHRTGSAGSLSSGYSSVTNSTVIGSPLRRRMTAQAVLLNNNGASVEEAEPSGR